MGDEPIHGHVSPLGAGLGGRCPRCGRGRLFAGFLELARSCSACRLSYEFADAGDGAAWFVMLIAGTIAVGAALWLEIAYQPPYWVHAAVALPLAVGLPLVLLRPVKGVLICQQYQTKARESGLDNG